MNSDLLILYEKLQSETLEKFEDVFFEIIPELKFEKGFEQRSEWHCFDVWNHTLETIKFCDDNVEDRLILLLHDIGKPFSFQNDGTVRHFKNHSKKSREISEKILDRLEINDELKNIILDIIEFHSTAIKIENITIDNYDFYKRLLKIQKCDAMGYEKEHSKITIEKLNKVSEKMKIIKR